MSNPMPAGLAARLHALAGRLADLRDRVREAVAVEVGRIVGEAARELITAALRGHRPNPTAAPHPRPGHVHTGRWDDDPDDWDRDGGDDPDPYRPTPDPPTRTPVAEATPPVGWVAVRTDGLAAARHWAGRTGRGWVGAAVAVLTAVASVFNNPTVRTTLSAFTALAELVAGVPPATA